MLSYDEAVVEINYLLNRLKEHISDPSAVEDVRDCVDALVEIGDIDVGPILKQLMEKAAPDFRPILAKGAELLEPIEVKR